MAGEKLVKVMRQVAGNANPSSSQTNVMFGTVTSINPLKINIENRYEVGTSLLVLSPFCFELKFQDSILWKGLEKGDKVNLLRYEKGQKYYVLDKGAIENDTNI